MGSYSPGFDSLKLLPSDVQVVFDLPDNRIVIKDISVTRKDALKIKWGGWTLGRLKDDLVRDQETEDFMEKFILFVLENFLCPTTKDKPSEELFRVIPIIPESQAHNWGKFIVDWTVQQADKYYKNVKQNSIGGCTYFLMKIASIPMQDNTPLIKLWTKDMIQRALQMP
ncbi:hypothetical protein L2E82_06044 [Cichorium intybus]|uniref:Uncharacterized protein n=1 Tax=Cichorium intybus TaxID=13427 RepID=A0ACB9H8I1_CICIN|nr:hypothetical protein L2E82_06044 [Cichorium intybus]